jgi:hypothetical protein
MNRSDLALANLIACYECSPTSRQVILNVRQTMTHFASSPTDEELLAFVEVWIDDLARGDYQTAYSRTEHDAYYRWTPGLMRAVIEGYGLPEPRRDGNVFHVSQRASARGMIHHRQVARDDMRPPALAEVWYDLPLNGEWSDLTATFRIERRQSGFAIVLQEIHVF